MPKTTVYICDALTTKGEDCNATAKYMLTPYVRRNNTIVGPHHYYACSNLAHVGEMVLEGFSSSHTCKVEAAAAEANTKPIDWSDVTHVTVHLLSPEGA